MNQQEEYIKAHSSPLSETLRWIERQTHLRSHYPRMLSGGDVGRLLETFSRMLAPRRILELGSFTGYATLCLAAGLAPGGVIDTVEGNDELEDILREAFSRSGMEGRINLILGDALKVIPTLEGPYDLVYIDANKREYPEYLRLLRGKVPPGGYIIADNVLWDGKVWADGGASDPQTRGLTAFNEAVAADEGLDNFILPLRDGLNIIRVKG